MNKHPYASNRFIQAKSNLKNLVDIMKSEDLDGFVEIVESEALSLHAMMMTSNPYFILFKPNTLSIIEKTWDLRKNKKILQEKKLLQIDFLLAQPRHHK